jgi:hypothetical protein
LPGGNRAWLSFSKTSFLGFRSRKAKKTTFLREVQRPREESSQTNSQNVFFSVFGREKIKNDVFEKSAPARVPRQESSLAKFLKNVFFSVFGHEKLKNDVFEKSAPARVPRAESSLAKFLKHVFFRVFGREKQKKRRF